MRKVSREYFTNTVLKLDVTLNVTGSKLFTTEFRLRNGNVVGKTVDRYGSDDEDYIMEDFFTNL